MDTLNADSLAAQMSGAATPVTPAESTESRSFEPDFNNVENEVDSVGSSDHSDHSDPTDNPLNNMGAPRGIFDNEPEDDTDRMDNGAADDDELTDDDKKRNYVYAQLYVVMIANGVCIGCQFLSGDWEEEGARKYSLSKAKQNEIARAWADVLNLEGAKKSPRNALYMMMGSMLGVLILTAAKEGFTKRRAKKKAEQKAAEKSGGHATHTSPQTEVVHTTAEGVNVHAPEKPTYKPPKDVNVKNNTHVPPTTMEVVKQPEIVPETPIAVEPVEAVTLEPVDLPTDKGTAKMKPEAAVDEAANQIKKTKAKQGGRQVGTKRDPKTGKMTPPTKMDADFFYYPWGKSAITSRQRKTLKKLGV